MSYSLEFHKKALREWKKLDPSIRQQLKKKLVERLETPRILADKLSGLDDLYKIKLRSSGFRLAYRVIDERIVVLLLAVGKREKDWIYRELEGR